MGKIDQQVFLFHILAQMGFRTVKEQVPPGVDTFLVSACICKHQITEGRVIFRMVIVKFNDVRPDVDVQVSGEVHDFRIQPAAVVKQGSPDLRFPVLAINEGVALADQELGGISTESCARFFRRHQFQPVFNGKDGQQVFRRFTIRLRMAQEVTQQGLQCDTYRHHQGIFKRIPCRVLVGNEEDHVSDDDVGSRQINVFRNFLFLKHLLQAAFLDNDRRQGRPEDAQIQPLFQQPESLGGGAVLQQQQCDGLTPALCVTGQEPKFFLRMDFT